MKYSEKLTQQYEIEIHQWAMWAAFDGGDTGYIYANECGDVISSHWVGTTLGVLPSGKVYAPWTTNQTMKDVIKDTAFCAAIEAVCEEYGMFADWNDGDLRISQCLDDVYESYLSLDGGDTWRHENKDFTTAEAIANREAEGVFSGAYLCNDRDGELNPVNLEDYISSTDEA